MSKVLVMTGGPAVGKTAIVKAILRVLAAKRTEILLCAPAVAIAVRNVSGRRRWSKLSEWLRPKPPVSRQFGMAS